MNHVAAGCCCCINSGVLPLDPLSSTLSILMSPSSQNGKATGILLSDPSRKWRFWFLPRRILILFYFPDASVHLGDDCSNIGHHHKRSNTHCRHIILIPIKPPILAVARSGNQFGEGPFNHTLYHGLCPHLWRHGARSLAVPLLVLPILHHDALSGLNGSDAHFQSAPLVFNLRPHIHAAVPLHDPHLLLSLPGGRAATFRVQSVLFLHFLIGSHQKVYRLKFGWKYMVTPSVLSGTELTDNLIVCLSLLPLQLVQHPPSSNRGWPS